MDKYQALQALRVSLGSQGRGKNSFSPSDLSSKKAVMSMGNSDHTLVKQAGHYNHI